MDPITEIDFLHDFEPGPLDVYREQSSFDRKRLAVLIEDEKLLRFKHKIWRTLENDPLFAHSPVDLPLEETRQLVTERILRIREYNLLSEDDALSDPRLMNAFQVAVGQYDWSICVKMWVMYEFFVNAIRGMGTGKHYDYVEAVNNDQIGGCVAVTEIGHGTNTRKLRTRATYDTMKQKFILNTPDTFENAKCWAGGLAKSATHAFVYAQLYTPDGVCHGLHCFIVPIRDRNTMLPFPGLTIGDMGSKCGLNGVDNGFMIFDNYEISRDCLMNKNGDVRLDGKYVTPFKDPNKRFGASLGNLSAGRTGVIGMCIGHLCCAVPIAVRYSAVRRQFGKDMEELPVIEYQMQQWRLFPYLAATFVVKFFGDKLFEELALFITNQYNRNDSYDLATAGVEIHAITSSAKPLISWLARDAIQECRESGGGHAYLRSAGLGRLRNDNDANCTYEGENNVLLQQTSNWLMGVYASSMEKTINTDTPFGTLTFLRMMEEMNSKQFDCKTLEEIQSPEFVLETYKWLLCYLLKLTSTKVNSQLGTGNDQFDAKNNSQIYYARTLSLVFIEHYILEKFLKKFICRLTKRDENIKNVMTSVMVLYGLWSLEKHSATLYQANFASGPLYGLLVRESILTLCEQLKSEAVSLADALAPPDFILNSTLGMSDGRVYKHLQSGMIQTPGCFQRPEWWKRFSQKLRSKL